MNLICLLIFMLLTIQAPGSQKELSLLSKAVFSQINQEIKPQCRSSFLSLIRKYKSTNKWFRIVDPDTNVTAYRSPTAQFGHWLEIEIRKDEKELLVKSITPRSDTHHILLAGSKCSSRQKVTNRLKVTKASGTINDSQLKKLMQQGQGLFYIWSPRMVYSMKHLKDFQSSAKLTNSSFHAFMDPSVEDEMAQLAGRSYKISKKYRQRLSSVELRMRQYDLHFPATYVYSKGKLHPERIIGVIPKEQLVLEIKRRIYELDQ